MGRRVIDETGNHYGRLLVLERAPSLDGSTVACWLCQCDCGQTKVIRGTSLRAGHTKSCGCIWRENLRIGWEKARTRLTINEIGNRHGRWLVLKRAVTPHDRAGVYWLCQCDCGQTKVVRGTILRKGGSKSCGCLQREMSSGRPCKPHGVAAFNNLFSLYRSGARQRDLKWQIPKTKFKELTSSSCFYCGVKPFREALPRGNGNTGSYLYNGLDRVNNEHGYTLDNVVPCCWECNDIKHAQPVKEFMGWINRLVKYQVAKKCERYAIRSTD